MYAFNSADCNFLLIVDSQQSSVSARAAGAHLEITTSRALDLDPRHDNDALQLQLKVIQGRTQGQSPNLFGHGPHPQHYGFSVRRRSGCGCFFAVQTRALDLAVKMCRGVANMSEIFTQQFSRKIKGFTGGVGILCEIPTPPSEQPLKFSTKLGLLCCIYE